MTQATLDGTSYSGSDGLAESHVMWMMPMRKSAEPSQIWWTTADKPPLRYGYVDSQTIARSTSS